MQFVGVECLWRGERVTQSPHTTTLASLGRLLHQQPGALQVRVLSAIAGQALDGQDGHWS